jgi:hypothetical protein
MPTNIINFAAERSRREVDAFLDDLATVKQLLLNVSAVADEETKGLADTLVALVDRLAEIGISQRSAAIVMDNDFRQRLRQLQDVPTSSSRSDDVPLLALMEA